MSQRTVFCIAASRGRADRIINELKGGRFSPMDVSILFVDPDVRDANRPADTTPDPTPESSATIRGVMAWVTDIKRIEIAGSAPLIASGPIAGALAGASTDGIAAGLLAFGMPQAEAGRYVAGIKAGHTLIAVHGSNPETGDRAREIFTTAAADDIFTMMNIRTQPLLSRPAFRTSRAATLASPLQ